MDFSLVNHKIRMLKIVAAVCLTDAFQEAITPRNGCVYRTITLLSCHFLSFLKDLPGGNLIGIQSYVPIVFWDLAGKEFTSHRIIFLSFSFFCMHICLDF